MAELGAAAGARQRAAAAPRALAPSRALHLDPVLLEPVTLYVIVANALRNFRTQVISKVCRYRFSNKRNVFLHTSTHRPAISASTPTEQPAKAECFRMLY